MPILSLFKDLESKLNLDFLRNLKLTKTSESVAGIDIGSSSIKAVQLKKEKEKAVLETYGELSLSRYGGAALGQAVRLPDEKIVEALSDLKKEAKITAERANVSIPLKYSFLTTINMPNMSDAEVDKAIPFEIKRYIPVPLSEVIFDWQIVPGFEGKEGGMKSKIEVLVVAIYKDFVEKYKNIVKGAGFKEAGFEIEVFSSVKSIIYKQPKPVLIIDLGASKTKMTIIHNGVFKSAYDFDKGFQDLTNVLSRSLNIDFERAELMKKDIGLSVRPEHKEIMSLFDPMLAYVFSEANRLSLEYRRKEGVAVGKIYLIGGGALFKGISDFAINKTGVEVETGNSFTKIEYPAFLETVLKDIGPVFANAVGLALMSV